jgi:signal transduction histidine kinase/tetratricopeptide (TPR) repeat protein
MSANIFLIKAVALGIILWLTGLAPLLAQVNVIDSLENELQNFEETDTKKIPVLIRLSLELVYVEPAKTQRYGQQALELAQKTNDLHGIASAYRTLSSVYSAQDNFITSSDYVQKALSIFEQLSDSVGIANCYISLGHTFRRQKNREQEIYYHRKSYQMFEALQIDNRIGVSAHNLGESYLNVGKIDSALYLTEKAIRINTQNKNQSVLSSCYKALGKIHLARNEQELAKQAFIKVLEISEELQENAQKFALIESLILLADIYEAEGKNTLVLKYLLLANEINSQFYLIEFTGDIFDKLIGYYLKNEDPLKAREYLQRSIAVLDSISNQQQQDRSELMLSAIKSYKLEEEKTRLENQNDFQAKLIKQQRVQLYLGVTLLVIFTLAIAGFTIFVKRLRLSNSELEKSKSLIEEQKQHLTKLNATKDKFFGIVGHDLRGPIGSVKNLLEVYFSPDFNLPEKDKAEIAEQVKKSMNTSYDLLVNLINWARVQMKSEKAKPKKIQIDKVVTTIFTIYENKAQEKNIDLINDIDSSHTVFADENHTELIIRNLVNNALKFTAENGVIIVKTIDEGNDLTIHIKDNGIGMNEDALQKLFKIDQGTRSTTGTSGEEGSGLGLILCKDYIKLNKGSITVSSELGKGTDFVVTLPKG